MEEEKKIELINKKIEDSKEKIIKLKKNEDNKKEIYIDDLLIKKFLIDFCSKYDGVFEIDNKDFYFLFLQFLKINDIDINTTPLKFGIKIKNLKIDGIERGKRSSRGFYKNIDIDKIINHYK